MNPDLKNMETKDIIELYKNTQEFLEFIEKEIKMSEVSE